VAPDAGEAVILELDQHRERVALRLACARALLRHLLRDPQLLLNVVSDLVRDHVRARDLARRPEPPREVLE